jgi:hypothetical protein
MQYTGLCDNARDFGTRRLLLAGRNARRSGSLAALQKRGYTGARHR